MVKLQLEKCRKKKIKILFLLKVPTLEVNGICSFSYQCRKNSSLICNGACTCPSNLYVQQVVFFVSLFFLSYRIWSDNDKDCICNADSEIYNNKCYRVLPLNKNKTDAELACREYNSSLLIIENEAEFDFIKKFYISTFYGFNIWVNFIFEIFI